MKGRNNAAVRETIDEHHTHSVFADEAASPSGRNDANILAVQEDVPQRIREIALLRGLGFTFREIGENFGISPQAVSLMLSRHHRAAQSLKRASQLRGLSARATNVLGRHAIRTREEALARRILDILPHERNCGKKTAEEIERWITSQSA